MHYEHHKSIEKLYDMICEEFDRTRNKPDEVLEASFKKGFFKSNGIILDNGCGNCRNSVLFNKSILIAGDISRNMLKKCMLNTADSIYYARYTLTNLPFRNDAFDSIICIAAIHHLKEEEIVTAMNEMRRVSKNGANLLISTWSIKILREKRLSRKIEKINEKYFSIGWKRIPRFYFLMDSKMLSTIVKESGFRDFHIFEYNMNNYVLVERNLKDK
ncbi:MAG: class I SAM-dependent methyltransferase [Thermoproteota archaeon]